MTIFYLRFLLKRKFEIFFCLFTKFFKNYILKSFPSPNSSFDTVSVQNKLTCILVGKIHLLIRLECLNYARNIQKVWRFEKNIKKLSLSQQLFYVTQKACYICLAKNLAEAVSPKQKKTINEICILAIMQRLYF